ncbi:transmembrane protein, putative (macronuclear) [Tetrahymena thermophila SB210]|uniref:Transmembrane protein, putative n=1 Tax=Tetrahymena thermophila (strain SB210) TaxID=312017 RepID=W7XJV0_TETTS|nr:transmembrane protein, putative [Tetrahymena thermophila SB210]EWS74349.1 transmembrane protein, putative [Tetrahymena thermophila SB210]|eukprot:XP_012653109.1 transmembrane protein, putative [Tetrahymena thermophila SB210]
MHPFRQLVKFGRCRKQCKKCWSVFKYDKARFFKIQVKIQLQWHYFKIIISLFIRRIYFFNLFFNFLLISILLPTYSTYVKFLIKKVQKKISQQQQLKRAFQKIRIEFLVNKQINLYQIVRKLYIFNQFCYIFLCV